MQKPNLNYIEFHYFNKHEEKKMPQVLMVYRTLIYKNPKLIFQNLSHFSHDKHMYLFGHNIIF